MYLGPDPSRQCKQLAEYSIQVTLDEQLHERLLIRGRGFVKFLEPPCQRMCTCQYQGEATPDVDNSGSDAVMQTMGGASK